MQKKERKYENFVKEISFDDFKKKVENGELNINANYDEVFVWNLIPGEIDSMVDNFIGMMDEARAIMSVDIMPEVLFKNAYAVKNHLGIVDMVFEFLPGKIDGKRLKDAFACEGSMDAYLLREYVPHEESTASTYVKEEIDAMGWGEKQKEVNEIEKQYEAGEITIFDVYKKFNWADDETLNEEKVNTLLEKVNGITIDELFKELEDFTDVEFTIFNKLLKENYPEVNEDLNKQMEAKEQKELEEIKKAQEAAKARYEELVKANWKYNVIQNFDGQKLALRLVPDLPGGLLEDEEIPEEVLQPFGKYEIIKKYSQDIYVYFDPFGFGGSNIPLPRVIKFDMQAVSKYILDESLEFEKNPDFNSIN